MNRPVVVGVDGSPESLVAAEHGARAAALRSRPLHLVHGYLHPLGYGVPVNPYDLGLPEPSDEARTMLEKAAADLRGRWPELTVEVRQVAGGPGATLVEESRRAELVVVGSRGLGGFAGLLLGSVSAQVAGHAHGPVLVVRPADRQVAADGPVLVGLDGSELAELAVGQAAEEAARRDVPLVLAHVVAVDARPEDTAGGEQGAGRLLAETAATVRQRHPELAVAERVLRSAEPASALVEASADAALVVVGSRGRGGFAGLLLGSVSQALVQHARCPVLVARPHAHTG
ncbi:universal stress protein UspA [Micromonospora echinospora]|uniref:Nucleotide-binding universal stress protein, UspA family n=1 Tax=Micromonospora echinospora TaxID=1877 RepID=A0A1C5A676_MICEC|nr:universal stress protein [Micromonospora echinospora]OZV73887.1 universal stress protein UspA [Micromonospora echinospora]SCF40581.1 Nucleotide-binding universal stress protein, UspA family [Micromonospora echinospora]